MSFWLCTVGLLAAQNGAGQQFFHEDLASIAVQFHIPAQPMERALKDFATQSKFQLLFVTDIIPEGTMAHEVSGMYLPEVALTQLLADTCLRYKLVNQSTVAIESAGGKCRAPGSTR